MILLFNQSLLLDFVTLNFLMSNQGANGVGGYYKAPQFLWWLAFSNRNNSANAANTSSFVFPVVPRKPGTSLLIQLSVSTHAPLPIQLTVHVSTHAL